MQRNGNRNYGQFVYWALDITIMQPEDNDLFSNIINELGQIAIKYYFSCYRVNETAFLFKGIFHSADRKRQTYFEKLGFKTVSHFPKSEWERLLKELRNTQAPNLVPEVVYRLNIKEPVVVKDKYLDYTPHKWQSDIMNQLTNVPHDRNLWWYWESIGGIGKTILCKHICLTMNAMVVSGASKDIRHGVASWLTNHDTIDVLIFDLTRTTEEYISYQAMEEIKNGLFFSSKYESKMFIYDCPHVIVFANFPPEIWKSSQDRWKVVALRKEDEYTYYQSLYEKLDDLVNPKKINHFRYPESVNSRLRYYTKAMQYWKLFDMKYRPKGKESKDTITDMKIDFDSIQDL